MANLRPRCRCSECALEFSLSGPHPNYDPRADFDGDGDVDEDDAWVWVDNANAACAFLAFAYDYRNRLVEVELRHDTLVQNPPPPPITHRYGYDAFGRRVKRTMDVGTGEERTVYFIYGGVPGGGGWQLLEEWEDVPSVGPALAAMFVHSGLYIDDVVQMRRWNEGEEAFEDFYYHSDDLSSVRALSDSGGELVELYDYHEYGLPTITDPNTIVNGRPLLLASSAVGNPFLFTGQMYDVETRLYHYRTRPYEPRMGRFISIDSIGVRSNPFPGPA